MRRDRSAFSLIEVLVAVTLSALLFAAAWRMFSQTRNIARNTQARLALHASAKGIYESLRNDLSTLEQHCALWLISAPGEKNTIDFVFMTSARDELGYQVNGGYSQPMATDLVWCRWVWRNGDKRLLSSRTPLARSWQVDPSIDGIPAPASPNFSTFPNVSFLSEPRRFTPNNDLAHLDDNRWNFTTAGGAPVGTGANTGDLTELERRLAPVCANVESCVIELVKPGVDQKQTADGINSSTFCARGIRMDGVASRNTVNPVNPASGSPAPNLVSFVDDEIDQRPLLLRIKVVLRDPATDLRLTFAFSFALPGPAARL